MIRDRWYTRTPDGTRTPTPHHGRGSRWEAGYRDNPRGWWRRQRFPRRWHAERFTRDMAAVLRGDLAALVGRP